MTSPFMTVAVLTVLWLIVVVPMVLRRSDEQARERSVRGFGRAMRALGRRPFTILGVGWRISTVLALAAGGAAWLLAVGFLSGLVGYVLFLRSQAQRDRDRRLSRQARLSARRTPSHELASYEAVEPALSA